MQAVLCLAWGGLAKGNQSVQQAEASVVSQKSPGVGSSPTAVTLSSCVTNQLMEPGFSISAGRARLSIVGLWRRTSLTRRVSLL